MPNSKRLGALVGPTIIATVLSEFPRVQPHLYDAQTPPVVYLSGVLLFVAGLALVRAHHHWAPDWSVLITLTGWFALALGLFRMFGAEFYQRGATQTHPAIFMVLEGLLLVVGLVITVKAYGKGGGESAPGETPYGAA